MQQIMLAMIMCKHMFFSPATKRGPTMPQQTRIWNQNLLHLDGWPRLNFGTRCGHACRALCSAHCRNTRKSTDVFTKKLRLDQKHILTTTWKQHNLRHRHTISTRGSQEWWSQLPLLRFSAVVVNLLCGSRFYFAFCVGAFLACQFSWGTPS